MQPRLAVLWLIIGTGLLRLAWCATLEASNDESYHWLYTKHPALSYFDHPPMTMVVEQVGLTLCGGWVHPLSLRLGFVLLFAGSTWFMYRWAAGLFDEQAGFWAAAMLNLSGYFTAFGGTFALPDSPFLFFALLTFWRSSVAVASGKLVDWFWVGLGFAGAMASKYHAVLLPAGVVLMALVRKDQRKLLLQPGPYLAVVMGLVGFLPVLLWNMQNDWASFRFQGGRASDAHTTPFLHEGPLKWLTGPMLYLLPWVWFWLVVELVRGWRQWNHTTDAIRLLLCQSLVPLLFFFVISGLSRSVLLHWPLVGFLPLYPLFGKNIGNLKTRWPRLFPWIVGSWVVLLFACAGFILLQARVGVVQFPPKAKDPSNDISGWESVERELRQQGYLDKPNSFFFTNLWYDSGQLAFAIRDQVPVRCYHAFDARGFAFWSKPEDDVGKTGYYLVVEEVSEQETLKEYAWCFESMKPVHEFWMTKFGKPFRPVKLYECKEMHTPYPFTNKKLK